MPWNTSAHQRRWPEGRGSPHCTCRRRDGGDWILLMKIRSRSPLRVSYAGGGTDVPPYPNLMGGVVLSSTIQNYAYCSITPRSDGKVTVSREDQDSYFGPDNLKTLK